MRAGRFRWIAIGGAAVVAMFGLPAGLPARAATFTPADEAELIADVATANTNGESDTIDLGGQTFTLNEPLVVESDGVESLTFTGPGVLRNSGNGQRVLRVAPGGRAILDSVTVTNVSATGNGGGIVNAGDLLIARSTITGNSTGVTPHGRQGGGIENTAALLVDSSTVSNNTATSGSTGGGSGGGISNSDTASAIVIASTISGNIAEGGAGGSRGLGGGIVNAGQLVVQLSTISGNEAGGSALSLGGAGGGVSNGGTFRAAVSTIAANAAEGGATSGGRGGGINVQPGGATDIHGSILGENTVGAGSGANASPPVGPDCAGALTSDPQGEGFNVVSDSTDCTGFRPTDLLDTDARLGPLALNPPGSTQTHAIAASSPARDLIPRTSSLCATGLTDQRGVARPQGVACDSGSYELVVTGGGSGGTPVPPGPPPPSDTSPPDTLIASGPDRTTARKGPDVPKTRDRTPGFTFTSTEPGSRFECSVDGADFVACSSPFTVQSKLTRGDRHTFAVRAIDGAGNVDPTPARLEFLVKKKPKRRTSADPCAAFGSLLRPGERCPFA